MKTRKAMKTKTNFRKAAMRSGAVVVSFVLVSFTVSAQGFWKKLLVNSSFNEIAIAMIEVPAVEKIAEVPVKGNASWIDYDKAFDPVLELEGWMMSEDFLSISDPEADFMEEEDAITGTDLITNFADGEGSLEIEEWMTSSPLWNM
jgi:hypothetical protein